MKPFPTSRTARRQQRGVTLIEALVALLVMALGLLSFAGLHSKLRQNSDIARQRAEAVRLAQEDMENLRAFSTVGAVGGLNASSQQATYNNIGDGWGTKGSAALASGNTTTANATYTITRAVTAVGTLRKDISVTYAWTDRSGAAQTVQLRSSIAGVDPKLAASMSLAPNGSPVKDPLGRDVQIPIPAKNLGDGTSVFKPNQGGGLAFVFNNDTGYVTRKCTSVSASLTTAQIAASDVQSGATGCTDLTTPAYILSGYVRFSLGGTPNATDPNDAPPGSLSIAIALDSSTPTAGTGPLGTLNRLNSSYWTIAPPSSSGYLTPECGAEDSKTVQYTMLVSYSQTNNGSTTTQTSANAVAIVPAATALTAAAIAPYTGLSSSVISNVTDLGERYIGYACVMYPIDLSGALAWTGRSTLVPSGWTLGTSSTTYKVCRYSTDYNQSGYVWYPTQVPASYPNTTMTKIDNAEHPNAYIRVNGGLSNQNFLVIKGNNACPTDGGVEIDGQGQDNYTDETTVLHQP